MAKICENCFLLHQADKHVMGNPKLTKDIKAHLMKCKERCYMYLTASNCTINEDGEVTIDNSGRKY